MLMIELEASSHTRRMLSQPRLVRGFGCRFHSSLVDASLPTPSGSTSNDPRSPSRESPLRTEPTGGSPEEFRAPKAYKVLEETCPPGSKDRQTFSQPQREHPPALTSRPTMIASRRSSPCGSPGHGAAT